MNGLLSLTRIYIESTALFQLGPRFETVDLEKLLELRNSARFGIYVSEVSWLEYLRKRKRDLSFLVDSLSKADRILEKHGRQIPEISLSLEKVKEYLADIDPHYREKVRKKGIEIVPLAGVAIDRLLKMSIECIPPFEEAEDESKEKGFRDSLIMFSILESLRKNCSESAVLVTQDQLLAIAFKSHALEYNAKVIVVQTLDEATSYIGETIAESERLRIKEESIEAIRMLSRYKDSIVQNIGEIRELTDNDLAQGFRWGLMTTVEQEGLDIKAVRSIRFERIDSAIWKDKHQATSRILFRCLCKAAVVIRSPYLVHAFDEPRRFKVGEPPSTGFNVNYSQGSFQEPTEERELPFDLYGVAEFERASPEHDWQLAKISIEKSLPAEEELHALVTAEIIHTGTPDRSVEGT